MKCTLTDVDGGKSTKQAKTGSDKIKPFRKFLKLFQQAKANWEKGKLCQRHFEPYQYQRKESRTGHEISRNDRTCGPDEIGIFLQHRSPTRLS